MKDLSWKTLSSNYLIREHWCTVRKDTCETPGGKIVDPYYVFEFPTWVATVPVTEDGKIVLVRQYRHALGEICLELPGGCVDDTDKSLSAAAARELAEETGFTASSMEYIGKISANPSTNNNLLHMYLAKGCRKTSLQQLDPNEEIEVELYSVDEVKQLLKEHKIIQAMHVTALMYAFQSMGEME